MRPRVKVPLNCPIGDVDLEPPTVLVYEEDSEADDPLHCLTKEYSKVSCLIFCLLI